MLSANSLVSSKLYWAFSHGFKNTDTKEGRTSMQCKNAFLVDASMMFPHVLWMQVTLSNPE